MEKSSTIAIIGAGSWGTALSMTAAWRNHEVSVWAREQEVLDAVRDRGENTLFLPGFAIPEGVCFSHDIAEVLAGAEVVLTVVPTQYCRDVFQAMRPHISEEMLFVSATKGIENKTLLRVSQILDAVLGPGLMARIAALSGPSFAREVAAGRPTAVTVASQDSETAVAVQEALSSDTFRIYTSTDITGVELGGALKNIIAIAAGIVEGLGLGSNTMAALVTRGLAEIERLGIAMGGQAATISGLSGMGDLVLTCTGMLSRNRSVGIEIGKGRTVKEITNGMRMVAEGISTTQGVMELSKKNGVEMPIAAKVNEILYNGKDPTIAVKELMGRALKAET
ncbi:NAD(P)H-dependent glycerol-3-phosphate dehydrogenase [Acidobacteriota bacterium]